MNIAIAKAIGNTPLINIKSEIPFYAKLEGTNLYGSMKDRAALYVIRELMESNKIGSHTHIIESSSGNFAVSVAGICSCLGISFTCVTDPLMNMTTRKIISSFGANIVVIDEPDENNIYVTKRLEYINDQLAKDKDLYWINQYNNPLIRDAYKSLANELIEQKEAIDYVFVPVSSCGTISGISKYLKEVKPTIKIVAVDLKSSSIFYKPTTQQKLPGMGFNSVPGNLQYAHIDEVVIVDELSCIIECRELLNKGLLVGPSSGSVVAAINKLCSHSTRIPEIVAIFPDKGDRYIATVFNDEWCQNNYPDFALYLERNNKHGNGSITN